MWKNLRDPYRKREIDILTKGDQPAPVRGGGGKRKSRSAGITVAEAVKKWPFYDSMSFYKPFIYERP